MKSALRVKTQSVFQTKFGCLAICRKAVFRADGILKVCFEVIWRNLCVNPFERGEKLFLVSLSGGVSGSGLSRRCGIWIDSLLWRTSSLGRKTKELKRRWKWNRLTRTEEISGWKWSDQRWTLLDWAIGWSTVGLGGSVRLSLSLNLHQPTIRLVWFGGGGGGRRPLFCIGLCPTPPEIFRAGRSVALFCLASFESFVVEKELQPIVFSSHFVTVLWHRVAFGFLFFYS